MVSAVGFRQSADTLPAGSLELVITLQRDVQALREITVTAGKSTYTADKNAYTISAKDPRLAPKALELLKTVPALFVSNDNTVTLNGKKNILILLDGKPIASANMLATIPSDMIRKVEVIANPSAQYDGEAIEGGNRTSNCFLTAFPTIFLL